MMRFELGLEEPNPKRAMQSAITIALSYVVGGIIPLAPYIIFHNINTAFYLSVAFTLFALAVFGFVKGKVHRGLQNQKRPADVDGGRAGGGGGLRAGQADFLILWLRCLLARGRHCTSASESATVQQTTSLPATHLSLNQFMWAFSPSSRSSCAASSGRCSGSGARARG